MPTSMAGLNYTVSLPAPAHGGKSMVYFIPTAREQTISFNLVFKNIYDQKAGFFIAGVSIIVLYISILKL